MFNDSIYFLEQAKCISKEPENDWLRWRFLRASIIYSLTSMDSYLNRFIEARIRKIPVENFSEVFSNSRLNRRTKLEIIVPIITNKVIDPKSQEMVDLQKIATIRNRLVHYSGGTKIYDDADPDGINIANAELAINMVRGMVKLLNELVGEKYPPWVDQTVSKAIR